MGSIGQRIARGARAATLGRNVLRHDRVTRALAGVWAAACLISARPVDAQAEQPPASPSRSALPAPQLESESEPDDPPRGGLGARASASAAPAPEASSTVTRAQMQERLPRSAPDALRYEPGVAVQQTGHGQASPYVRGMTGQQVVHSFDGVRMNNGLYRQGPNQYFFTVDSYTLDHIEVVRGSSSTRYGSDALGGAILAVPRSPFLHGGSDVEAHARAYGRFTTADWERGGRAELELSLPGRIGLLAGAGARRVARLETGGPIDTGRYPAPLVPRFESDGRTQLGTGFDEVTFDARAVHAITSRLQLVSAIYGYRQHDAPRTDQCPPPEAPFDECLNVTRQHRTLGHISLRGDAGPHLREVELQLSIQHHDETSENDRPRSFVRNEYDNSVYTLGAVARGATRAIPIGAGASYRLRFGAEAYRDGVSSSSAQVLTDLEPGPMRFARSRGQYIDGSSFMQLGAFSELELSPIDGLTVHGGGRLAAVAAFAAPDEASGSEAVAQRWAAAVGRAGLGARVTHNTKLQVNFDQGFRAPNLDDLTSRQQIGPGFQLGNESLRPERSNTLELGVLSALSFLQLDAWLFVTWIEDAIARVPRTPDACPPQTDACRASRALLQLVNAAGTARLVGAEGVATLQFSDELSLRATGSYAVGEGPTPRPDDGDATEPLSRVPPLNGTAELRYADRARGFYVAAASRWALAQRRLATSDLSDARIPIGGTPGYAVLDMRAGYRYDEHLHVSAVFENALDVAYRVHGSSIHGPGRGLLLGVVLSH